MCMMISSRSSKSSTEFKVEYGELRELKESRTIAVEVTSENIDDLFTKCETILGEGLKDEYWRRVHDHDEPDQSKLELFCILQYPASVRSVQEECGKRIDTLFEQYRGQDRGDAVKPPRGICADRPAVSRTESREDSSPGLIEFRKETSRI